MKTISVSEYFGGIMGELKEKAVVKKKLVARGAPSKVASVVAKTRIFTALTPEQEALYGSISSDKKNNLDAAAIRAAKYAQRK